MTPFAFTKYYLCCFFLFISFICFGQNKVFSAPHKDTAKVIQVDLSTLIKNSKDYHGMWVETTGSILVMFETFAVVTEENNEYKVNGIKALWLSLDKKMKVNADSLNGKTWIIRGKINTNLRGHMGQYPGTIEQIYFLKQL